MQVFRFGLHSRDKIYPDAAVIARSPVRRIWTQTLKNEKFNVCLGEMSYFEVGFGRIH